MATSTVIALVALALAALVTIFCLVKFFMGSSPVRSSSSKGRESSTKRSSRAPRSSSPVTFGNKVEGFIDRGNGDSYVNLFALFNAAALEEAEAKKAEEQDQLAKKAAARDNRAKFRASLLSTTTHSLSAGWRSLKIRAARAIMPKPLQREQSSEVVSFSNNKKQRHG